MQQKSPDGHLKGDYKCLWEHIFMLFLKTSPAYLVRKILNASTNRTGNCQPV